MNAADVLRLCYEKALDSPDPSTQNAAVLCHQGLGDRLYPVPMTLACNRFPYGVSYTNERWERPLKYSFVEHAERNSIFRAARRGQPTFGLVMVCPWAACADCARAIVQAGISRLITQRHDDEGRWKESIDVAFEILDEGGVKVEFVEGRVGGPPILRDGKPWHP